MGSGTVTTVRRLAVVSVLVAGLAACGAAEESVPSAGSAPWSADEWTTAAKQPVEPGPDAVPAVAGVVATGLAAPWGVAFLPDASALVSLRDSGTLVHIGADGSVSEVGEIPGVTGGGSGGFLGLTPTEGGLLGLAASPDFTEDRLVYAYLTAAQENRVVRLTFDGTSLGEPEVVLDGIPTANIHNGGRIAFGPDGYLYVTTGDASEQGLAQEIDALNGKILRVTRDGQPAPGNPFAGSPVWTLGHRNVQGIGWDDEGRMYASEFGQNTFDELNLIEPGGNYGWPVVEGDGGGDEYVDPLLTWEPAEASPSGITVHGGAVYVAGLRGQRLWQVPVAGVGETGEVGEPQAYLTGEYGRLRAVELAPDGSLWVLTNNTDGRGDPRPGDDRILRVTFD